MNGQLGDRLAVAAARTADWVARISIAVGALYGAVYLVSPRRVAGYLGAAPATDFALYYREASIGVRHGWAHVYDIDLFVQATRDLGIVSNDSPQLGSIGLPLLDWLVAPLTFLPLAWAYPIWLAVIASALAGTWWLLAPAAERRVQAALLILFAPAIVTLVLGQATALLALGVAAAVALLRAGWQWPAGVALSLSLVKPQLVVLVPVCLLAAGLWRPVVATGVVAVAVAIGALVVTGPGPLNELLLRLMAAARHPATWGVPTDLAPAAVLQGAGRTAFQGAVAAIAATAAWRERTRAHPGRVVAAGLVGSLLATSYLHFQDLVLLLAVAWMVQTEDARAWERRLFGASYLPAALGLPLVPILTASWLVASCLRRSPAHHELETQGFESHHANH